MVAAHLKVGPSSVHEELWELGRVKQILSEDDRKKSKS